MVEREEFGWAGFGDASRQLSQQVVDSGFAPDVVLGIARGGLLPAGAMAYAMECKNLFTMNVEFYTGVDSRLDVPVMLPPILNAADLDDLKVLIVDDVADTGKTLELVHEFCADHVAEARTAVLYHKPRSIIVPDYAWKQTDLWINFPWSTLPQVVAGGDPLRPGATPADEVSGG